MVVAALDIAKGLWGLVFKVFIIIMPLIIFLEWARTQTWFARFIAAASRLFAPIGLRAEAMFSLITGIFFGISYGAGVLIPQSQSGELSRKQIFLIAAFLCLCHAIVEDTLLFVVLGANGAIIVVTRVIAAVAVVFVLSRLSWPIPVETAAEATDNV
jgi:hypothetical protein